MALNPHSKALLSAWLDYYRELGIYDFYRRETPRSAAAPQEPAASPPPGPAPVPQTSSFAASRPGLFEAPQPEAGIRDHAEALRVIREDLGDCTRCPLHKMGRKQIVFGVGNPDAQLMFVGEGPGADEDEQGIPFVGRAGQLLTKMIEAMGLKRDQVYIANVVKCRPPGNRTPEREECETCSPFLLRQIAAIRPRVIVALGAVAARTLLGLNESMARLRGRWYEFAPPRSKTGSAGDPAYGGARLAVTYHPAFLLRDPRQKKEAWKDLQMVMGELGLPAPRKPPE